MDKQLQGELADKNELIDVLQQKLKTYKEIIQDAETMVAELQAQIQTQNLIRTYRYSCNIYCEAATKPRQVSD
jgi:chromosome segregation ATPase